jgi:hypothetical protein
MRPGVPMHSLARSDLDATRRGFVERLGQCSKAAISRYRRISSATALLGSPMAFPSTSGRFGSSTGWLRSKTY